MPEEINQVTAKGKLQFKNKWLLIAGVVIIIAILILGGAYLLNSSKASISSEENAIEKGTETPTEAMESAAIQANFVCADNKTIDATFINREEPSVDLVLSAGTTLNLPRVESASGGKYANEDQSIVFWSSGNDAYLEENAVKTYVDCSTGS